MLKLQKDIKKAYLEARRHKKWKANTLQFSLNDNSLKNLALKIANKNYHIKPSLCFISFIPEKELEKICIKLFKTLGEEKKV